MEVKIITIFIYIQESSQQKNCIDECEEKYLKNNDHNNKLQNDNVFSRKNIAIFEAMNHNCSIICPNTCKNIFPKLSVRDMKMKFNGNSNIIIEYKQFRQFIYIAKPSSNLINLFCDLGGIFGLYFGIALMDFSKLFELLLQKSREVINLILIYNRFNFIVKFKRYILKLKVFIQYMGKIRWNILTYAISAPILFTQLYSIIYTYFQYTTETTYEFIPYIRSDNSYSINEFPAITICNENLLEKIIFDKHYNIDQVEYLNKKYEELKKHPGMTFLDIIPESIVLNIYFKVSIEGYNILWSKYTHDIRLLMTLTDYIIHYKSYYFSDDIEIRKMSNELVDMFGAYNYSDFKAKMNRFENKHLYGLKPLQQLLNFYSDHYQCIVNLIPSYTCSYFGQTLKMVSPLGKCHTYLSSLYPNHTLVRSIIFKYDQFTAFTRGSVSNPITFRRFPNYLQKYIYLHERNSIVSMNSHLTVTDHIGQIEETTNLGVIFKKVYNFFI